MLFICNCGPGIQSSYIAKMESFEARDLRGESLLVWCASASAGVMARTKGKTQVVWLCSGCLSQLGRAGWAGRPQASMTQIAWP